MRTPIIALRLSSSRRLARRWLTQVGPRAGGYRPYPMRADPLHAAIGQVCTSDVWLENELREVVRHFVHHTAGMSLMPNGFGLVQAAAVRLVEDHVEDDVVREIILDALSAARAAHTARNRVVHDLWIEVDYQQDTAEEAKRFKRLRFQVGTVDPIESAPITIADLEQVHLDLRRAHVRAFHIPFVLSPRLAWSHPNSINMVRGRFTFDERGAPVPLDPATQ